MRPINCTVIQRGTETNELWWFQGADAANYSERVKLKARGKGFPEGIDILPNGNILILDRLGFVNNFGHELTEYTRSGVIVSTTKVKAPVRLNAGATSVPSSEKNATSWVAFMAKYQARWFPELL